MAQTRITRAVDRPVDGTTAASRPGQEERAEFRAIRLLVAFILGASAGYLTLRLGIPGPGLLAGFLVGVVAGIMAAGLSGLVVVSLGTLVGLWLVGLTGFASSIYWLLFLSVMVLVVNGFALVWLFRRWRSHERGTGLLDDPALMATALVTFGLPYLFILLTIELTGRR